MLWSMALGIRDLVIFSILLEGRDGWAICVLDLARGEKLVRRVLLR